MTDPPLPLLLELPLQFSLLVEFFIGKVPVTDQDSRVITLVNLNPGFQINILYFTASFFRD
jgi:hypothetical protein